MLRVICVLETLSSRTSTSTTTHGSSKRERERDDECKSMIDLVMAKDMLSGVSDVKAMHGLVTSLLSNQMIVLR